MDNELFGQLKPRLQRLILDQVFNQFYNQFKIAFDDCENEFKRELFMNSNYMFY